MNPGAQALPFGRVSGWSSDAGYKRAVRPFAGRDLVEWWRRGWGRGAPVAHWCGRAVRGAATGLWQSARIFEEDWLVGGEWLEGGAAWTPDPPRVWCGACGGSVGPGERHSPCLACRGRRPLGDGVVRLGEYAPPLQTWIMRLKYGMDDVAGEWLGTRLAAAVRRARAIDLERTLVVPVPMAWLRRWHRGIDHARVLAAAVAGTLGVPLVQPLRHLGGVPRSAQERSERRRPRICERGGRWRRGGRPLRGWTVVLIDDVLTTGATLREGVRWLRGMGATEVRVAVVAVTPAPDRRGVLGRGGEVGSGSAAEGSKENLARIRQRP